MLIHEHHVPVEEIDHERVLADGGQERHLDVGRDHQDANRNDRGNGKDGRTDDGVMLARKRLHHDVSLTKVEHAIREEDGNGADSQNQASYQHLEQRPYVLKALAPFARHEVARQEERVERDGPAKCENVARIDPEANGKGQNDARRKRKRHLGHPTHREAPDNERDDVPERVVRVGNEHVGATEGRPEHKDAVEQHIGDAQSCELAKRPRALTLAPVARDKGERRHVKGVDGHRDERHRPEVGAAIEEVPQHDEEDEQKLDVVPIRASLVLLQRVGVLCAQGVYHAIAANATHMLHASSFRQETSIAHIQPVRLPQNEPLRGA